MSSSTANWLHWRSFLAALEQGTLSGAAAHLGLSQPTVGRHLDDLEQAIGQKLFTRSQAGLLATNLARTLAGPAKAMEVAAFALERSCAQGSIGVGRTVRITASDIVGVEILPPILARLRDAVGDVRIELALADAQEDLLLRSADIAIRMAEPKQDRLLCAKLGTARLSLFADRDYLQRFGAPTCLADLRDHALIGVDRNRTRMDDPRITAAGVTVDTLSFCCDSDVGQFAALRAGLGVGIAQTVIAAAYHGLIPVLPKTFAMDLPVWIAMHEDLKRDELLYTAFGVLKNELRKLYAESDKPDI